jgi:hypothetical protein
MCIKYNHGLIRFRLGITIARIVSSIGGSNRQLDHGKTAWRATTHAQAEQASSREQARLDVQLSTEQTAWADPRRRRRLASSEATYVPASDEEPLCRYGVVNGDDAAQGPGLATPSRILGRAQASAVVYTTDRRGVVVAACTISLAYSL